MIQRMRFGFWMPVFGGWLRNVEDEGMPATFAYQRELAQQADRDGWDVTLIAELNLNDIKGPDRKSTRLNSSHRTISYAVFCLKKKKKNTKIYTRDITRSNTL